MKACMRPGCKAPALSELDTGWKWMVIFILQISLSPRKALLKLYHLYNNILFYDYMYCGLIHNILSHNRDKF
jgi:hypothetical protein